MVVSQINPLMFIVGKTNGTQHAIKGQRALVPADLKNIQIRLPRNCNNEHLSSLETKFVWCDKSAYHKQHNRPALVNRTLTKLKEINPFYSDIVVDNSLFDLSEQNVPTLWNFLSSHSMEYETDSSEEIEGNTYAGQNVQCVTNTHTTVKHNVDGPDIDSSQTVNIPSTKSQILLCHTNDSDCKARPFPKESSIGQCHFNSQRKIMITALTYIHSQLKNQYKIC